MVAVGGSALVPVSGDRARLEPHDAGGGAPRTHGGGCLRALRGHPGAPLAGAARSVRKRGVWRGPRPDRDRGGPRGPPPGGGCRSAVGVHPPRRPPPARPAGDPRVAPRVCRVRAGRAGPTGAVAGDQRRPAARALRPSRLAGAPAGGRRRWGLGAGRRRPTCRSGCAAAGRRARRAVCARRLGRGAARPRARSGRRAGARTPGATPASPPGRWRLGGPVGGRLLRHRHLGHGGA